VAWAAEWVEDLPVVLLHGMGSGGFAWSPVVPALQAAGRQVVVLELPGHEYGRVIEDELSFDVDVMVRQVLEELDRRGIARADLVGNSLGGWIALRLAAEGRARSVICLAPAGGWAHGGWFDRWLRLQFRMGRLAARRLSHGRLRPLLDTTRVQHLLLFSMVSLPGNISPRAAVRAVRSVAECEALRVFLNNPAAARLGDPGAADSRVLVAWAAQDRILVSARARRTFLQWVPGASEVVLPGVGHVPMSDDPTLVAEVILQFVEGSVEALAS
jgi:pimeloyl-ACP methyl ester carboxylesterase